MKIIFLTAFLFFLASLCKLDDGTLHFPFSIEYWRHCALSGGCTRVKKWKYQIFDYLKRESNPQPQRSQSHTCAPAPRVASIQNQNQKYFYGVFMWSHFSMTTWRLSRRPTTNSTHTVLKQFSLNPFSKRVQTYATHVRTYQ